MADNYSIENLAQEGDEGTVVAILLITISTYTDIQMGGILFISSCLDHRL